jgi:hypothetical protein
MPIVSTLCSGMILAVLRVFPVRGTARHVVWERLEL